MNAVYPWPSQDIVELTGRDRLDFLHRLSSQFFRDLQAGDCRPAAFLNAQGQVLFYFYALEETEKTLLFVLPGQAEALRDHLERFHFSEALEYNIGTAGRYVEVREGGGLRFTPQNPGPREFMNLQQWKESRIQHLEPISEDCYGSPVLLLETGLYSYFHPNKGCYPGQEVVERILMKGDVPRKAMVLSWQEPIAEGAPLSVFREGAKVGQLGKIIETREGNWGYAMVLRTQCDGSATYALGSPEGPRTKVQALAGPLPRP